MRRLIDVVAALVLATVLVPVFVVLSLVVLLAMGRPIFFAQTRSGRHGKEFRLLKFRTMRAATFAGEGDLDRTPQAGRILRRTSLDELPQLWNVLRGEMSIIGPRPTLPEQVKRYSQRQRGRLAIRPGLTGWAQVNGRNSISWPDRIELDLWYIENRTPLLDLRILARTVLSVARGNGVVGVDGINPDFPVLLPGQNLLLINEPELP